MKTSQTHYNIISFGWLDYCVDITELDMVEFSGWYRYHTMCYNCFNFWLQFRAEKKELKSTAQTDKALLEKSSLDITLLPESSEDQRLAELIKYEDVSDGSMYYSITTMLKNWLVIDCP